MKLLIENWRSFVNEEDEQTEGETSVSQEDIDALFDDHASGRKFNAETEKVLDSGATINEVEATEEGYDVVLQDFIDIHNNMSDAIAGENPSLIKAYMNLAYEKKEWMKALDQIKAAIERDARSVSFYNNAIHNEVWNDDSHAFYGEKEKVLAKFLVQNNSYLKSITRLFRYLAAIERIFTSAFGTDTNKLNNYHKAVSAIKLFTGESVDTVRKPEGFLSDKAKIISNNERMLNRISQTLTGLDIVARPILNVQSQQYFDENDFNVRNNIALLNINNQHYNDLRTKISNLTREERPTKFSYEFANGFLTYAGKNSPPLFIQQGTEIYRGVNAPEDKYLKYKGMAPGTIKPYHDIVSWTTDIDIAKGFAFGEKEKNDNKSPPNPHPIILRVKVSRGLYVEEYSAYPHEKEVICGGDLVLTDVSPWREQNSEGVIMDGLFLDFEYK
jgi:hypothetical protein